MLKDFKIFKYPFMDAVAAKKFSLYGFNYMDIVTDGAINPKVNYPAGLFEEDLFIEFENEDKLFIDKEISNFPIRRYDRAILSYKPWSADPGAVQGGFGNLYIILKRYPVTIFDPPKENPYIHFIENVVNIAGSGTVHKWLGKNRTNANYELKIPYLPQKYNLCNFIINSNATSWQAFIHGFIDTYQFNATTNPIIAYAERQMAIRTTRFRLWLENKDTDTTKAFYVTMFWTTT